MDIKKTWVACTRLSHAQALETALSKDKQPVGPRREIYSPYISMGYKSPTRTLRLRYLLGHSNFPGLSVEDNVRKRPFPFGCPYKRCPQPQDSIKILTRQPFKGPLVAANLQIKSKQNKKIQRNLRCLSLFIVSERN